MKKVLVGLAGLVAVLIVTVLVAPSFIDWTSYRNGIAAEIERVLGRRVVIDGAVEASIVPTPRLSLHGLRLGNLTGASSPYMAQVEALELRVALWPLLSGKIVVTSVVLRKPVVELELLPDGQRNWLFGRSIEDVQFENATVTDGTVIYRETRSGAEERVEGINARLAADSFYGPLRAAGELRYNAVPLRFSLSTGRFDPRGRAVTPINLTAEVPGPARGLVRAQSVRAAGGFIGTVRLPEAAPLQIDGQFKLRGDDLADFVAALGVGSDVPDVLAQSFSLESAVDLKDKMLTANSVSLQLGDTRAQGAVNAAFTSDEPQIDVTLTLGRIDLDAWLAAAAKKAASRPAAESNASAEPEEFELPVNVRLTLDVTADALTHRSGAARQIKLAAEMGDGVVDIYQFSVQLPGGTDATFNGKLLAADGKPRVNGLAEIASDDFRSLLGWLDVDISGLPAGRLNKVSATGHLGATTEHAGDRRTRPALRQHPGDRRAGRRAARAAGLRGQSHRRPIQSRFLSAGRQRGGRGDDGGRGGGCIAAHGADRIRRQPAAAGRSVGARQHHRARYQSRWHPGQWRAHHAQAGRRRSRGRRGRACPARSTGSRASRAPMWNSRSRRTSRRACCAPPESCCRCPKRQSSRSPPKASCPAAMPPTSSTRPSMPGSLRWRSRAMWRFRRQRRPGSRSISAFSIPTTSA